MKAKKVLAFAILCLLPSVSAWAVWVWSPESGKFVNPEGTAQDAADEQYNYAMQFYKEKNLDEAVKQLELLVKKYPAAKGAAEAQYRLGTIYEEKGDYLKAFNSYKVILESYPQSDRLNEVIEREFRIGNLFLSGKKARLLGLEILPSLPRAIEVFKHIVDRAPYSEYGDKAQFRLGLAYKKSGQFQESVEAFQAVIDQYPQSPLVAEARYQIAETSFQRSAAQFRDQRALDEASKQLDRFLTKYPDTEASEKAAKLRQQIDEKNAEKNYRIGLYYEKDNYLQSSVIYYEDVARRYPDTAWGKKAEEKLKSLKAPDSYLSEEAAKIDSEIKVLEQQLQAVSEKDDFERDQIKRKIDRLKQRGKTIAHNKKESLQSHTKDIQRRDRELKQKFKNLDKKRKMLKNNTSEDLKRALDRWQTSLEAEQAALDEEKKQQADWSRSMGIKESPFSLEFLPFAGEKLPEVEKIRRIEAKKYYKLSEEKRDLLAEKELLYKQHDETLTLLKQMQGEPSTSPTQLAKGKGLESISAEDLKKQLEATSAEIKSLEQDLDLKKQAYEKYYGKDWKDWLKSPVTVVTASTGAIVQPISKMINTFGSSEDELKKLSLEQLLERQMHLKEKLSAQQSLIDTLNEAFNAELAMQEQKRLMEMLSSKADIDVGALRKTIKRTEKDIRSRYQEIKDRHKHKKELLKQLENLLEEHKKAKSKVGASIDKVAKPVTGFAYYAKAFFVGLPNKDVKLTKSAQDLGGENVAESGEALRLKDEIEKESLLIEARNKEINHLQKELEILKAKASLAGGYKFRAAMVQLPYQFIQEAVESANRLVPKKNRHEVLINLLDEKTREMESIKAEMERVNAQIEEKSGGEPADVKGVDAKTSKEEKPNQESLKSDIKSIAERVEILHRTYDNQNAMLDARMQLGDKTLPETVAEMPERKLSKKEKKVHNELQEIEESIQKLIKREGDLDEEESEILQKRIAKIEKVTKKNLSKALLEDLSVERQRMEERLSQIKLRRDFLSQELKRIQ